MTDYRDVLEGRARWALLRGDCLGALTALPDASVDAVITDPPYSSGGQFRGDRTNSTNDKYVNSEDAGRRPDFLGDSRDQHAYAYWCALWLSECYRIARPGAPICLFTDWRQLPVTTDLLQAGGWVWRGIAVWDKSEAARPQKGRFRSQCEYIAWGSKGPMLEPSPTDPCLPGVFRHVVRQDDKHHIAGKPTRLMRDVVAICAPGGRILDPFAGSATTGVAALETGRSFIGVEQDAAYHAIGAARLREADLQASLPRLFPRETVTPLAFSDPDATDSGEEVPA